ncbi:hypothetical protein [Arenibacterium sp. LLYu02]|uniref:hypothetical protein n=1 Tax=Arenibacterium sp. LLYu02 TaxID=3404132 RepID=UPI003B20FFB4
MLALNIPLSAASLVGRASYSAALPFHGETARHDLTAATRTSRTPKLMHRMGKFLATSAVVIGLAVPLALTANGANAASSQRKIVVQADPGGAVSQRIAEIQAYRKQGVRVQIEGQCNSSCTLYLGMPQTCVSRQALLGFHGPMSQFAGIPLPPQQFEEWSQIMASYYPSPVRKWFLKDARYTLNGIKTISGEQLIKLGVPECA